MQSLQVVEQQIRNIKNGSEYKRLANTPRRGVRDDRRYKQYQFQLDILEKQKKEHLEKCAQRNTTYGRAGRLQPSAPRHKVMRSSGPSIIPVASQPPETQNVYRCVRGSQPLLPKKKEESSGPAQRSLGAPDKLEEQFAELDDLTEEI